jgi:hypothetical protein
MSEYMDLMEKFFMHEIKQSWGYHNMVFEVTGPFLMEVIKNFSI